MIRDASLVTKNSRISRLFVVLAALLWVCGLLGLADLQPLTLSLDGILVHWRLWAFVTAGFYEQYALSGLLSLAGLALAAPLLEKHWGSLRTLRFFVLVSTAAFVGVFGTLLGCWVLGLGSPHVLWHSPLSGLPGVLGGFSVALKQRFGDWRLAWGLRARHLPTVLLMSGLAILGLHLLASSGAGDTHDPVLGGADGGSGNAALATGASPTEIAVSAAAPAWLPYVMHWGPLLIMTWGIYFGWLYLRFYDRDDDQQTVGDLSPGFALSSFVPEWLAPFLAPLVDAYLAGPAYELCANQLGMFAEARRSSGLGLPYHMPSGAGGPAATAAAGSHHLHPFGELPLAGGPPSRAASSTSLFSTASSPAGGQGGPAASLALTTAAVSALNDFSYDSLLMDVGDFDDESFLQQGSEDPASQRRLAVAIKAVDEKLALLAGGSLDEASAGGRAASQLAKPISFHRPASASASVASASTLASAAPMSPPRSAVATAAARPPQPVAAAAAAAGIGGSVVDGVLKLPPLPNSTDPAPSPLP